MAAAAAAARKPSAFGPPLPPAATATVEGGAAAASGGLPSAKTDEALPLGNPQFQDTWEDNGESHGFRVRGPGYLSGGGKVDAGAPFGELVRADLYKVCTWEDGGCANRPPANRGTLIEPHRFAGRGVSREMCLRILPPAIFSYECFRSAYECSAYECFTRSPGPVVVDIHGAMLHVEAKLQDRS